MREFSCFGQDCDICVCVCVCVCVCEKQIRPHPVPYVKCIKHAELIRIRYVKYLGNQLLLLLHICRVYVCMFFVFLDKTTEDHLCYGHVYRNCMPYLRKLCYY